MLNSYQNIIIDGNNLLYRAFYTKKPTKIVNNLNVTTIEQFLYMLKAVCSRFKSQRVFLTWDKKLTPEKKNFRKELLAYKEQRVDDDKKQELLDNISHIQKFMNLLGIKTIYPVSTEADDVIYHLSKKYKNSIIISNDKDLLQLVDDGIDVYLSNKDIIINKNNFEENTGVKKELFILYKSIMGDVSDNVSGLYKYGPVRSKQLTEKIWQNGVIDFSKAGLEDEQIKVIERNLKVIDLSYFEKHCPEDQINFDQQIQESEKIMFESENLRELFKKYGLNRFCNNFGEWNNVFNNNVNDSDLLSKICL